MQLETKKFEAEEEILPLPFYKNDKKVVPAMMLSRVEKYKKKKKNPMKKAIVTSTIACTALFSTTVVHADMGITESLKKWYMERVSEVENFLVSSAETEANQQKANLLKQVREQTEQSVKELQEYADQRRSEINANISEKSTDTSEILNAHIKEDVIETKESIDETLAAEKTDKEAKKEDKSVTQKDEADSESTDTPPEDSKEQNPENNPEEPGVSDSGTNDDDNEKNETP